MLFDRFASFSIWARIRPDAITVWDDERVQRALSWYYLVMKDEAPAKFMLAKIVEVEDDPKKLAIEQLEELNKTKKKELIKLVEQARRRKYTLDDFKKDSRDMPKFSLLHIDAELARRYASPCRLCERRCMVKREEQVGACRVGIKTYVHSWFHHLGEEAPLVPSGTIFYGGCNFTCVFCQNYDISQVYPRSGEVVDARRLAEIQKQLRIHGARNINHVGGDPTPNLHTIVESLIYLDTNVPQLWNSNMYMSMESMNILVDIIDIWLPDFKYGNDKCAWRLSSAKNYVKVVTRNLSIAIKYGDMIIRHLVLPGHLECCTKPVLRWIAENLPRDKVLVNVMEQYRPEHFVLRYPKRWPEIARRLTDREIVDARLYAEKLGLIYDPVS